jgi:Leucine-rich repeat (LRR) protein
MHLILSHNRITELSPTNLFAETHQLTVLDLSYNALSMLPDSNVFAALTALGTVLVLYRKVSDGMLLFENASVTFPTTTPAGMILENPGLCVIQSHTVGLSDVQSHTVPLGCPTSLITHPISTPSRH